MPRENRKRGKKHKKKAEEGPAQEEVEIEEAEAGPSWIVPAPAKEDGPPTDAPFGYIELDLKAYFKNVDVQMRDWQQDSVVQPDADTDPNAERHMFFLAALTEMTGKEKQLATDPECSPILERMCYSMDDFVRRVFLDSLTGSCEVLMKNRYASHVFQTFFTVVKETISREARGIFPSMPESPDKGELRTLTKLAQDICDEILPIVSSLIMDPFASHVLRALLLLLNPSVTPKDDDTLRSKKSASWKARQGPMKSVFTAEKGKQKEVLPTVSPPEFRDMSRNILDAFLKAVGDNELRALSIDKVASPTLTILVEVEADNGLSDRPGSLMDRVCDGLITATHDDATRLVKPSEYLASYIRDPTSSHLLETIVSRAPDPVFKLLWTAYFDGNLQRLALHPVANFVVAKAVHRVSSDQLSDVWSELSNVWGTMINSARTGVLRAAIERSSVLGVCQDGISEALFAALKQSSAEDRTFLVPCLLRLQNLHEYQQAQSETKKDHQGDKHDGDPLAPKVQGAILLQSLLWLSSPHNQPVIDSIASLNTEHKLAMSHNATASRVLDALIESPTVPTQAKRQFILSLIDNFHLLIDDRIGSRIADRCWAFADTYFKKKIATALIPHEQFLVASYYGKFFSRNLNLYLLQRRPEEWVNWQSRQKVSTEETVRDNSTAAAPVKVEAENSVEKKRKRGRDEIDALFDTTLGKKMKKGVLASETKGPAVISGDLADVLGAIRAAPTHVEPKGRKKR